MLVKTDYIHKGKRAMRRTRLPNHFGSIRYLGAGRQNAYAVHVTVKVEGDRGSISGRKAICYTKGWEEGTRCWSFFMQE